MYPISANKGKFYIGRIEIEAIPIFMGLETKIGVPSGNNFPPLEVVLFETISAIREDIKKKTGIDLNEANAYRYIVYGSRQVPEMNVADGKVPGSDERQLVFDLYKINPKI